MSRDMGISQRLLAPRALRVILVCFLIGLTKAFQHASFILPRHTSIVSPANLQMIHRRRLLLTPRMSTASGPIGAVKVGSAVLETYMGFLEAAPLVTKASPLFHLSK